MPLPWMHLRPASMTSHFDESIMIGTREMSGSEAISLRNLSIAASESSIASSMLMSMTWAPFSTCWRATASASSKRPSRIIRAKALEPVTLVRSPTLTYSESAPMLNGSRPDRRSLRRDFRHFSRVDRSNPLGDGRDVLGRGAAAAADDIDDAGSAQSRSRRPASRRSRRSRRRRWAGRRWGGPRRSSRRRATALRRTGAIPWRRARS
jgi:hypothetical protein